MVYLFYLRHRIKSKICLIERQITDENDPPDYLLQRWLEDNIMYSSVLSKDKKLLRIKCNLPKLQEEVEVKVKIKDPFDLEFLPEIEANAINKAFIIEYEPIQL